MRNTRTGEIMSDEQAQMYLQKSKRLILAYAIKPQINEIQVFAGLPFKVVRYATYEEYVENVVLPNEGAEDDVDKNYSFFEVVVAD